MLAFDIQGFSWVKGRTLCAYGNSGSILLRDVFLRHGLNCKSQTNLAVVDYFPVQDFLILLKINVEVKLANTKLFM